MPPIKEGRGLTREDILLLMETYNNMVKPLTELLQVSGNILSNVDTIVSKLDECTNRLNSIGGNIESSLTEGKGQCKLDHEKIGNRVHIAWIASGTLAVGLMSLVWKVFVVFDDLEKLQMLDTIAKAVGVS